jgi:hypothetical protein
MFPRLIEAQVELASIYAKAVPQRCRPKRPHLPAGSKARSHGQQPGSVAGVRGIGGRPHAQLSRIPAAGAYPGLLR